MTLLLTEEDVRVLLDMPTALEAVEESFRLQASGDAWSHPRRRFAMPERVYLNYMAAADRQAVGWARNSIRPHGEEPGFWWCSIARTRANSRR